ncbi:hypothetical protein GIB67_008491 [Kingdonia uniflora]|uniref:Uncharacterized protein n=1 Tax=Kingdonia uniflora TaxID=39325 RepID=A0A7J7N5P4_9MAGN|nr:hypothetical protein GIB67_008491 [Kingdonia uniflora]
MDYFWEYDLMTEHILPKSITLCDPKPFIPEVKSGGVSDLRCEDKGTLEWKCVDSKLIQTLGLTSGVRKVSL